MKKLLLLFMVSISSIPLFACTVHTNRIVFAFIVSPTTDDAQSWQEIVDMAQEYSVLLEQNKSFTITLLDQGLKTAERMFKFAEQKKCIDKWSLINLDPDEFGKKFEGRPYRYLKFELAKEQFTDEQWLQLEKQTEELVIYCENTKEDFSLEYYLSGIIKLFTPILPA